MREIQNAFSHLSSFVVNKSFSHSHSLYIIKCLSISLILTYVASTHGGNIRQVDFFCKVSVITCIFY